MTLKTSEGHRTRSNKNGRARSSELSIEGPNATSIEGNGAAPIEGTASISLEDDTAELALADTWPGSKLQSETHGRGEPSTRISSPAAEARQPSPKANRARKNGDSARGTPHNEQADPEKVRLVAEINAVWRRLEEEEDKRLRLGEEIEELHLALSEEQRARSSAAREKRAAEQREVEAERDAQQAQARRAELEAELEGLRRELELRRKQLIKRGAATASGLVGIALVLGTALGKSAVRTRRLFH